MFMGGKEKIAAHIVQVIQQHAGDATRYLEPFMGGASIASRAARLFPAATLADVDPDLVTLWSAARDGWVPPTSLSRAEYAAVRAEPDPSPLRGFAAYGCSFGGKRWGGYASDGKGRDYVGQARRGVLAKAAGLAGSTIVRANYTDHAPGAGWVAYCDPPYAGTTPYVGAPAWDAARFWQTMDAWADAGAVVLVSEYTAPDHWQAVWERQKQMALGRYTSDRVAVERVFIRASR